MIDESSRAADARRGRYGYFTESGDEYVITDPRPPRPWVNVIANPRIGLVVSQTGSGFTWVDNSQLAVLTNWQQDFARDESGKFLYCRDAETGETWSLAPAPVWAAGAEYQCRHALGDTTFRAVCGTVESRWTLGCDAEETVELWRVELRNNGTAPRRLELVPYLEWCCGVAPAPRREFHKLFIETWFDAARGAVFARNHMWDVGSKRYGHWNTDFPYVTAFAATVPVVAAEGEKSAFVGRNGSFRAPAALAASAWPGEFGRHGDPIAALRCPVILAPGETKVLGFVLAVNSCPDGAAALVDRFARVDAIDAALGRARVGWRERLSAHRIATPDPVFDALINDWVRYQAISARIWGRCGYYQQSGAFGFRDQLQDSQVWLTIDPVKTRTQLDLHARHQFADGSVYHWWHPLSELGHVTKMTDDLLWLSFVAANYIKETGRFDVLDDKAPYLDDATAYPLTDHVERAFRRVFARTGPRGIPYIGAGDWNDGLSAVGLEERGESVWLGLFLAGLLADWTEIHRRRGDTAHADEFARRRRELVDAINKYAWDGAWYQRGTLDDGSVFGSSTNRVGRIFLNAQTWAVLNDVAPPERAALAMDALRKHLVSEAGALLLAPAYDRPVPEIGYITRYAPGLRENGGVYTHAATWAIAAAAKVKDADLVAQLLRAINPANKEPDRYWAEPYVLPGNVDGPDSPHHGRGGWTWYTGSAAWLHRVVTQWVLGVRPDWDGLTIDPCLPTGWDHARMVRPYRGATYEFTFERSDRGAVSLVLDGRPIPGNHIAPPSAAGERHDVRVLCP